MNLPRKKLPIGIQNFAEIVDGGYYYVDKTEYAYRLADQGKYYFLSRPRRFGKSLFLDTLKELFEGKEVLFRGLYVQDRWDWSKKYPVLRISFGGGVLKNLRSLDEVLHQQLDSYERGYELPARYPDLRSRFRDLIEQLHRRSGLGVVVLVDEYDKPILDNISDSAVALQMRDGLRDFYSVIKDSDAHIRFAFLTGVSKFGKVSLFSGLNNLTDISVSADCSAICGYTEHDADTVFAAELDGLERAEIRRWYNGYNWLGEAVYNPFDLLLLFKNREFKPYWFETGTPTFLIDLLTERHTWLPALGRLEADAEMLSTFDIGNIPTEALMFQAGYLTIAQRERISGEYYFRLRFPNREVEQSLYGNLLRAWTHEAQAAVKNKKALFRLLSSNDLGGLKALFHAFYAAIPHDWYRNNPLAQYEGYWASVFYSYFAALGLTPQAEEATNHGCIDMTVRLNGRIYLFEFKVVELTPEGCALQQIKDRGYADKYRAEGATIHLIGVEFSKETRNIVGFEVETL